MKRIILATMALLALSISLVGAIPVLAADQGSCLLDPSYVRIYENKIGDTSDGNDSLFVCNSEPDLRDIDHTIPTNCRDDLFGGSTWNNCMSSFTFFVASTTKICLYSGADYTGHLIYSGLQSGQNVRRNAPTSWNDTLSSLRFISSSASC